MKKKYSKALAIMCAVTMATSSSQLPSIYADGDTPIVENNEEGEKKEVEVGYENGENVFNFNQLKFAGTWGPSHVVDEETGKVTVTFENAYDQIFFELPEGLDPERVTKIQLNGENLDGAVAVKAENGVGGTEYTSYGTSVELSPGTQFTVIDLMFLGGDNKEITVDSITLTLEEAVVPEVQMDIPDLKSVIATEDGLGEDAYVGCAVTGAETADENVMKLATKHFNAVTLGNELKLDCMLGYNNASSKDVEFTYVDSTTFEPVDKNAENAMMVPVLNFKNAEERLDMFLDWNKANPDKQVKVRGHVLVWHSQAPGWFFKKNYDGLFQDNTGAPELKATDGVADEENGTYAEDATKEEMDRRQEWYIKTMLEHFTAEDSKYKDLFYGWDVVNEAVSDNSGTYRNAQEGSRWWNIYGDQSFITNAFVYANKYAPKSLKLYYNDYNETVATKRDGIVQLLADVKATEGARIDGFGMQGHYGIDSPTMGQVEEAVRAYSKVVDEVMLTELDVKASSDYDGTDATRAAEYTKQAWYYKHLYDLLVSLDKEEGINVSGIVVWGTVDKYSWLNDSNNVGGASNGGAQCPLLFDSKYQAKPSYWAFVDPEKLEPYIQNVFVLESEDGSFDNANTYSFADDKVSCDFAPIWCEDELSVKVTVKGELADTDKVILYYSEGEVKKVEVAVKDMTKIEGGYEAILSLDGAYKVGDARLDVVVESGEGKVAFNDVKYTQEESDQYFAKANFRPFAVIPKGTVEVDGKVDEIWNGATTVPLTINLGANVKSEAKLLWDEDNLYVIVNVEDSVLNKDSANAYEQDSLEVFIDENNHKTDSYEEDDKQYRINYENEQSFNGTNCTADNVESVAVVPEEGGGYSIEAAFKWTEDDKPEIGDLIGLELQINDADESGSRVGTLSWYDASGQGWSAPSVFGTAMLGDSALILLKEKVDKLNEKVKDLKEKLKETNADKDAIQAELDKAKAELEEAKKALENAGKEAEKPAEENKDAAEAAKVGDKVEDKNFEYIVTKDGEVEVTGAKNKDAKKVTIAKTVKINGVNYKVTSIKAKAFYASKKLTKVTIGANVTKIGAKAFAKCTELKSVNVKSKKLKTIGKQAFSGDKKLTSFKMKVNKKLKTVGKKAFKGVSKKCKLFVPKNKKKAYKKTLRKGGFKGKIK